MTVPASPMKEQLTIAFGCLSIVVVVLAVSFYFGGVNGKPFLLVTFSSVAGLVPILPSLLRTTVTGPYHHVKIFTAGVLVVPFAVLVAGFIIQGSRGPVFLAALFGCVLGCLIATFGRSK